MKNGETDLPDRTQSFARRIIRVLEALPKKAAANIIGNQVLRSGTSVGANHRETNRLIALVVTLLKHSRQS